MYPKQLLVAVSTFRENTSTIVVQLPLILPLRFQTSPMPTLPTATRPGRLVPDRRLLAIHRQPRATSDSLHPLRRPIPSRRLLRPNASSQSPESPAAANVTSPIIDVERMKADAVQSELEALRAQVSELKKIVDLQQSSFDRLERELSNSRASTSNGFAPPFPVPAAAAAAAPSASASEGKPFGSALLRGGNVVRVFPPYIDRSVSCSTTWRFQYFNALHSSC